MNPLQFYTSETYISEPDLGGKEHRLTIERVVAEDVMTQAGNKRKRVVLGFKGCRKGLVLNKTNVRTLAIAYGREAEAWIGKQITLYPTVCDAFGVKDTPCIRVRAEKGGAQ